MKINKWVQPLKLGDKVAIISPSSPPESAELVQKGANFLAKLGLLPVVGESCYAQYGYLAGSDELRAHDINKYFADPTISGIFCARGGYGLQRILELVDFDIIAKNPKVFCGYSDISALHNTIPERAGFITYHTPMLATLKFSQADPYTITEFTRQFFGNSIGQIKNPEGFEMEFFGEGVTEGKLCGGNLSIITSSLATAYEINTRNNILFIEEVAEEPYKIDRQLNQLRLAGKLDAAAGIIFGDFADCTASDPNFSLTIDEIIQNLNLKVPYIQGFKCGHCYPTASLPMGALARIDATTATLEVLA